MTQVIYRESHELFEKMSEILESYAITEAPNGDPLLGYYFPCFPVSDIVIEFLEFMRIHLQHCDICGEYHNIDKIPLSCQTGDGEI